MKISGIIKNFDLPLLFVSGLLLILGVTLQYTSSLSNPTMSIFWRQLTFASVGAVVLVCMANYNYHTLARVNRGTYIILIVLLLFVLLFGREIRGSARWINLGFFQLQPAELAKLVVIIGLARWFYLFRGEINAWRNVIITFLLAAVPAGLVLVEPDLGSALVILAVWFGILLVSPISKKRLIVLAFCGILAAGAVWQFALHDYQRNRLETFLDPNLDPKGTGYNVRQALISVGSGQLFGRGLGRGLQSQLRFLPERQTDFIFATAAEEIGFIGSAVVVALYALLMSRILVIAGRARDDLGKYLSYGVFFLFFFQALINIAMNIGMAPVTGIPLPLLSYGGSSLLVTMLALGLMHNISWQSRALRF